MILHPMSQWNPDQIAAHHLKGLAFAELKRSEFKEDWQVTSFRNHHMKKELEALGPQFSQKNLQVVLLKGFALLGDIYPDWGSRFTSDVDILVDSFQLKEVTKILARNGFNKQEEKTWMGNQFKSLFIKKTEQWEISIEVHSRLFWHRQKLGHQLKPSTQISNYYILSDEDMLLHLAGHYAFQHNFLKLFWLVDIQRFLERRSNTLNWSIFWKKAQFFHLQESCKIVLFLCGEQGGKCAPGLSWRQKMLRRLVTQSFLMAPRSQPWRYHLIKVLVKDSIFDSLRYTLLWFFSYKLSLFK